MKNLFLFILTIFCIQQTAFGQSTWYDNSHLVEHQRTFKSMCNYISHGSNKKVQDERLVGYVFNNQAVYDSTSYMYSGTRGSQLNFLFVGFNRNDYDSSIRYNIDRVQQSRSIQTYNANNYWLTEERANYFNSVWNNSFKTTNTYNLNNLIETELQQTWTNSVMNWNNNYWYENVYSGNDLITRYQFSWNGTSWDSTERLDNVYVNGRLVELTYYNKNSTTKAWEASTRYSYNYNGTGQVLSVVYKSNNTGNWRNISRDSFTYNVADQRVTYLYQTYDNNNSQWKNGTFVINTWVGNRMTSSEYQGWENNAWKNQSKFIYSYNSNGNIVQTITEEWTGSDYVYTGLGGSYKQKYYYETYENGAAVQDLKSEFGDIRIYPNPFHTNLHIEIEKNNSLVTLVKILDLQGRQVSEFKLLDFKKDVVIDLNELKVGMYIVQLQSKNGFTYSTKISKE